MDRLTELGFFWLIFPIPSYFGPHSWQKKRSSILSRWSKIVKNGPELAIIPIKWEENVNINLLVKFEFKPFIGIRTMLILKISPKAINRSINQQGFMERRREKNQNQMLWKIRKWYYFRRKWFKRKHFLDIKIRFQKNQIGRRRRSKQNHHELFWQSTFEKMYSRMPTRVPKNSFAFFYG